MTLSERVCIQGGGDYAAEERNHGPQHGEWRAKVKSGSASYYPSESDMHYFLHGKLNQAFEAHLSGLYTENMTFWVLVWGGGVNGPLFTF